MAPRSLSLKDGLRGKNKHSCQEKIGWFKPYAIGGTKEMVGFNQCIHACCTYKDQPHNTDTHTEFPNKTFCGALVPPAPNKLPKAAKKEHSISTLDATFCPLTLTSYT